MFAQKEAKKPLLSCCFSSPSRWRSLLLVLVLLVLIHTVWFFTSQTTSGSTSLIRFTDDDQALEETVVFRCGMENCFRGVVSTNLPLYINMTVNDPLRFHCHDGRLAIPWPRFNDDYCDCRDGSDEPGTSACSHLRRPPLFHCAEANKAISTAFVDDGVCDCCDGSDEAGQSCPNTCSASPLDVVPPPKEELQHPTMRPGKRLVNPVSLPLKILISVLLTVHLCVGVWILSVVIRTRNVNQVAPVRKVHI